MGILRSKRCEDTHVHCEKTELCEDTRERFEKQPMSVLKRKLCEDSHEHVFQKTNLC